jgi:dinuclear metal center YbgI/SA1388 family protein
VPSLAEVIAVLDSWYPPATAERWDSVGLTCGDPRESISRVLLAVDCLPLTVAEAIESGCQLLLTHHPLLLSPVHSIATTDPKGSMLHSMVRAGLAHFVAHTNADVAEFGVSAALADALGLQDVQPLEPGPTAELDQLAVFVPADHLPGLIDALAEAGAGAVGNYDRCTFSVEGEGTFRPLAGAAPFDGEIGTLSRKREVRVSMVLPRARREAVIAAMRRAHPYEEVAFELTEQATLDAATGTGRIGRLPAELTLREFTAEVTRRLPRTGVGVRAAGDPDRIVRTVAVCGGSGAGYADLARRSGADAYLTADLKHHSTLEAVAERGAISDEPAMALLDATHYATEAVWLPVLARRLTDHFDGTLDVSVSGIVTDPWQIHDH